MMAAQSVLESKTTSTEHPHVARYPGVQGGKPVIVGSRLDIATLAAYHTRHSYTVDQLLEAYPHITPAQMYDAISYYYDHQQEIDELIRRNDEVYQRHLEETSGERAQTAPR